MTKIEIHGVPRFQVDVSLQVVRTLIAIGHLHYDSVCKQACVQGGFIYGWNNLLTYQEESNSHERAVPTGDFRQLDTTLKICEMARYMQLDAAEKEALGEYIVAVQYALRRANEVCKQWVDRD